MNNSQIASFPPQRLPLNKKGKEWRERHLHWAENSSFLNNTIIRKSILNKKINFDLYNGKLNKKDIKLYLNPFNKIANYIPENIQHFPVMNQVLDLIVGEEVNRKIKMTAMVANPDAVSDYEEKKVAAIKNQLKEFLTRDIPEEQLQQEAEKLQKYANYEYQDIYEVMANYILNEAFKNTDFDSKLAEGLKLVTICNEEIYLFDIVRGSAVMETLNPKKVYTFRSSQSNKIEDADIIIIEDYWSRGKIQDIFYEVLTESDLKVLDDLANNVMGSGVMEGYIDPSNEFMYLPTDVSYSETFDNVIGLANELGMPNNQYTDADGNIRVLRIYWKSQRLLYKVKRYDPIDGNPVESYEPEIYHANKTLGEESKKYWVSEWWEGTKIGNSIYTNIRPKKIQYRRLDDPTYCHPGIVGQIYSTNQMRGQSMVDKMKPLQYLYDIIMDKLLNVIALHVGKVPEIDTAKMAWDDPEKFLNFIKTDGIAYVNSFKESNKGVASGQYNTVGGRTLDFDQSASIKMFGDLLEYIRKSMYDIVGMPPQRLGEISNRETVGGVERAVTQSSHITAPMMAIHDNVKKRCAEILLETEKIAWKENKRKVQYAGDDGIALILDIDGPEVASRSYNIYAESDMNQAALRQKLEMAAQAWAQNDTVKPSTLMSIFTDISTQGIKRKLEADYEAKIQRETEQFQQQQQQVQQQQQALQEIEQFKMQLEQQKIQIEDLNNQRDNATKLQIKMLELRNTGEEVDMGDIEKLQLNKEKLDSEIKSKQDQIKLAWSSLEEQIRHNKETEKISKNKPVKTK